jgi:chemotaxis regulatin CheY-phosphate phosphatase CheZ
MSEATGLRDEGERARSATEGDYIGMDAAITAAGFADVPELLSRAALIINKMLESLKAGQQVLQRAAVEKLHHTNTKLHEISTATESAATDIMDGLDRAFLLVDQLDGEDVGPRGAEIGGQLRDELFAVMTHLQFQDITSQQLDHASSIIQDMEHYLDEFVVLFDLPTIGKVRGHDAIRLHSEHRPYDPCATTLDAEQRQAIVDEILTVKAR